MSHLTLDYIDTLDPGLKAVIKISETLSAFTAYDKYQGGYSTFVYDRLTHTRFFVETNYHSSHLNDLKEVVELEGNMIILKSNYECLLLTKVTDGYSQHSIDDTLYDYMKANLKVPPPEPTWLPTGLSRIRSNGNFDFAIVSKDEKTYEVHSLILAGVWPFFKTMLDSNMKESSEKKMEIPYPHSWIEVMLSYFYEEDLKMEFEQATGVIVLAKVYDIPTLCDLAIAKIKKETLDTTKCLEGWRNVYEARCDSMQLYLAKYLGEHLQELQKSSDMVAQFSQEEAVQLMMDISRCK